MSAFGSKSGLQREQQGLQGDCGNELGLSPDRGDASECPRGYRAVQTFQQVATVRADETPTWVPGQDRHTDHSGDHGKDHVSGIFLPQ